MTNANANTNSNIMRQSIFKMAWPIFIEVLLQMLVGNVDQFMVSQYSQASVAAIGNANQIINIIIIMLSVMSSATTILIARYLGARDDRKIAEVSAVSLLVSAVFSLGSTALLLTFCDKVFAWLRVPAPIFEETTAYFTVVMGGVILQGLYFSFAACFRGYSWTKTTMLVSSFMNIVNIFGNWLLIYGFGPIPSLGLLGVAISTNISKLVGLALIAYIFVKYLNVKLSFNCLRQFPWPTLREILHISVPAGGETLSYQASQAVIMKMVNIFGLVVINTKVYVYIVVMFAYLFALAISAALQIIVGFLIGAGRIDEVSGRVWHTVRMTVVVSTALTTLMYLGSDYIFRIFTDDPAILHLGKQIFFVEIFLELGRAVNIVMVRSLQAAGDIKTPVTVGIAGMWLVAVGAGYFFGIACDMGLVGIWLGMMLDECIRAIIFIIRWRGGTWKRKRGIKTVTA